MGKPTGFLEYERYVPRKRQPEDRVKDWNELKGYYSEEELRIQAARCMDCGVPFCQSGIMLNGMVSGCPLHNLIPQWNNLVYHGKWEEAYRRLSRTNPFPEFTARVCPAPCEGSCTEGHVTKPVTICNIEYAIIEKAFENDWVTAEKFPDTGKSIAIVGSGPAGLSAAWYLAIRGHQVTVYERQEEPGGLLMYGIPNMKLDKRIVRRRLSLMEKLGVSFRCNVEVGVDIKVTELLDQYDAVLLAIGATKARTLNIPGNDAKGIFMAVDYLKANTRDLVKPEYKYYVKNETSMDNELLTEIQNERYNSMNAKDKHVIVIGGGDTGTDCVGTAIRQGAKKVIQFEITSRPQEERDNERNPWPEWPRVLKTDYGQEEAIHIYGEDPRIYEISTTDIVKDETGAAKGLHTVKVEWKYKNGRLVPIPIPGSETYWKAELVLIAMGFLGPERKIIDELGLATDHRGDILADTATFETSRTNVFACGDARRGQSLVVWGIEEGKLAAEAIHRYIAVR